MKFLKTFFRIQASKSSDLIEHFSISKKCKQIIQGNDSWFYVIFVWIIFLNLTLKAYFEFYLLYIFIPKIITHFSLCLKKNPRIRQAHYNRNVNQIMY